MSICYSAGVWYWCLILVIAMLLSLSGHAYRISPTRFNPSLHLPITDLITSISIDRYHSTSAFKSRIGRFNRRYSSKVLFSQKSDIGTDVHVNTRSSTIPTKTGINASSNNGNVPLKIMIFMDGTWVYYSLLKGRNDCPVKTKYGRNWKRTHIVDWQKLTSKIADSIHSQLFPDSSVNNRGVEVVRTCAFTSSRKDSHPSGVRMKMVKDFQGCNFETHMYETIGLQEKCVDISLAVEMLYLATVPGFSPFTYLLRLCLYYTHFDFEYAISIVSYYRCL